MMARMMIIIMAVMMTMMVVMMTMMEVMMMMSMVHPAATPCPVASIATPLMFCPEDVVMTTTGSPGLMVVITRPPFRSSHSIMDPAFNFVLIIFNASLADFFQMVGIWVQNPIRIIDHDEDNLEIKIDEHKITFMVVIQISHKSSH